jgi:hypothetical protein
MTGSNSFWFANVDSGFYPEQISQSVRLDGDVSDTKFIYTPSGDGNKKTFTFSAWVKRSNLDSSNQMGLLNCDKHPHAPVHHLYFDTDDTLQYRWGDGGSAGSESGGVYVDRQFRDVSSWYHIVLNYDTTQSTKTDRIRIYVNGTRQTLVASYNGPHGDHYPTEDYVSSYVNMNEDGVPIIFGAMGNGGSYLRFFSGYMAELNYIDGTNYDADNFGQTKEGVWIPKEISGLSYGTHGCRLKFQDSSSLGDDTSGEGNDRTASNLVASDQVPDSPTNNFCTLNSIAPVIANTPTYSQGNLRIQSTWDSNWRSGISNFKMTSGKWYFEFRPIGGSYQIVGIASDESDATATSATQYLGKTTTGYGYQSSDGTVNNNASAVYTGSAYGTSNTIGVAVDLDNNKLYFAEDNTWQNSGDPTSGSTGTGAVSITDKDGYFIVVSVYETSSIGQLNFGQDSTFKGTISAGNNADGNGIGDFVYAPPSGYLALCSSNLPEPTIGPNSTTQADDHFNAIIYSGNGANSHGITGVNFQPDFVWIKARNQNSSHYLVDSVRGTGTGDSFRALLTESTDAEYTSENDQLRTLDSDGFTLDDNSDTDFYVNRGSDTYVAWNWKGGTTSGIDTTGQDITPSGYSFNQDAGFSIVAYTGNKTDQQGVPHGLGAKPDWVIIKDRDNASTQWVIAFPQISGNDYLYYDSQAKSADSGNVFYFTPTTTTVEISDHDEVNKNSTKYIMYCFRSIEGYSRIGTYEGNASDDGTYVYTGFRPRYVLLKNIDATESGGASWIIYDTTRSPTNVMDDRLYPNANNSEYTNANYNIDFLSNGFKIRDGSANYGYNNANTYVYISFAEQPFKYANAR